MIEGSNQRNASNFRNEPVFGLIAQLSMLHPIRNLQLTDRPYFTEVSGDGLRVVMATRSGKCDLFDHNLQPLDEINLGTGVAWLQLNETGSILLVGFAGYIDGYATAPRIAHSFRLEVAETSSGCCVFMPNENALCIASGENRAMLTAWDLSSSKKIAQTPLPARGGAGYMLVGHPEGEAMGAVAFSGQSEEWMFWAHYARGQLKVFSEPEIEGVSIPRFHPTGRELVSHHESLGLCRVLFPSGKLIGSCDPSEAFPENPDDSFAYDIHFLPDDQFLAWQENLALHRFDLRTMRPIDTVLTGVDGMTFGRDRFFSGRSWRLADKRLLTSDFRVERKTKNRVDTLRLWDASTIFGDLPTPDPSRPYTRMLTGNGSSPP
jgi:hypothetical protein